MIHEMVGGPNVHNHEHISFLSYLIRVLLANKRYEKIKCQKNEKNKDIKLGA